jgi:hypothetical protein
VSAVAERLSEDELRVLLERAVPQLPAPPQRLERVRERALRRRRRRTVGVAATAVVAVALAGLVLPGLGDRSGDRVPDAVRTLAPSAAGGAPSATDLTPTGSDPTPTVDGGASRPPPTSAPALGPFHFTELAGLQLDLPVGWYTLAPPKAGATYVSSQPLGLPKDGCLHPLDGFCTPLVRTLAPDGVLMMLSLSHNQAVADKIRTGGRTVSTTGMVTSCRSVGGTVQLGGLIADMSGSDVLIQVTVCLAGPTAARQAQVQDALTAADFT